MNNIRVFITSMGVVTPLSKGSAETLAALQENLRGIEKLTLFTPAFHPHLPVGQVQEELNEEEAPRTHLLALMAAKEACEKLSEPPEAVIMGVTTGGMTLTERAIKEGKRKAILYKMHGTGSVADYVAGKIGCKGTVMTVSTACSSGGAAFKLALELLRAGKAKRVLTGGADSLCRLTYYGFNALQLIDTEGARPLDKNRSGMSVGEGAACFILEAASEPPENALAELLGAGLTCDAYHPAAPHPEGAGALLAMRLALEDAGRNIRELAYINIHGTGTRENDAAEAKALRALFSENLPPHSSSKGAFGHSLAAAGAVEAAVCLLAMNEGLIPANTGLKELDEALGLYPVTAPQKAEIPIALSNSFGFGGNNASLLFGKPTLKSGGKELKPLRKLEIVSSACISGAGLTEQTIESFLNGESCKGLLDIGEISNSLPPKQVRRLKRLPRTFLSLALEAIKRAGENSEPKAIFFGTGFGPQSETYDFLKQLFESNEQFTSPTDFVGSVHNAPAGQGAIWFKSTGPNITMTGGDYSFEQALYAAALIAPEGENALLLGADEGHAILSPLFDHSVERAGELSDGGGAFIVRSKASANGLSLSMLFYETALNNPDIIKAMVERVGATLNGFENIGAIFAGIPAVDEELARKQLKEFIELSGCRVPVIDYRKILGEYATVSATATAIAANALTRGSLPKALSGGLEVIDLKNKSILILGFGDALTAVKAGL